MELAVDTRDWKFNKDEANERADDAELEEVASRILEKHIKAFEELAK